MLFRYDFGEKLDLSKFKKQAPFYISQMREISFELYVHDFKINLDIATPDGQNAHTVSFFIEELKRDVDGEVLTKRIIEPMRDTRFTEIKDIQDLFIITDYKSHFNSNSSSDTIEKVCKIIRIIHKINRLKAFL